LKAFVRRASLPTFPQVNLTPTMFFSKELAMSERIHQFDFLTG
jgi:hypothetical protein